MHVCHISWLWETMSMHNPCLILWTTPYRNSQRTIKWSSYCTPYSYNWYLHKLLSCFAKTRTARDSVYAMHCYNRTSSISVYYQSPLSCVFKSTVLCRNSSHSALGETKLGRSMVMLKYSALLIQRSLPPLLGCTIIGRSSGGVPTSFLMTGFTWWKSLKVCEQ